MFVKEHLHKYEINNSIRLFFRKPPPLSKHMKRGAPHTVEKDSTPKLDLKVIRVLLQMSVGFSMRLGSGTEPGPGFTSASD